MRMRKKIKAIIRVAHGKPSRGKRCWSMRGRTTLLTEPSVAEPRERWKKWAIELIQGVKIREVPRPPRIEKSRRKCQHSEQNVGYLRENLLSL